MVHVFLGTTYLLASILALALCASAAPTHSYSLSTISRRQNGEPPFNGPQTIQTYDVTPVTGGSIVEDCVVTFTPIVVDGRNLVREERSCSRLFVPNGSPLPLPSPPITTTVSTAPPPGQTAPPPPNAPPPPPPPGDTTITSDPAATTTTTDGAPGTGTPPLDPGATDPPLTTDPGAGGQPQPSDPAATPTPGGEGTADGGGNGGVVVIGPSSVPADATNSPQNQTPSGTRAANEGAPSPSGSNVEIPGKKFEVLPIGLGVFAGISVIALIVVGLVTYERTKYRKAFRQRRLAASGAEMGYGGMTERR